MTYTKDELEFMLKRMRVASDAFYNLARLAGCHSFLEFTGLMNEYIQICERAFKAGVDFTQTSIHSGRGLEIRDYEARYIHEKLECIFGTSLELSMRVPAPVD